MYIIVQPQGGLDSYTRAFGITRELYNLTAPQETQELYQHECVVFPLIAHPTSGLYAMRVELDYAIPVHNQAKLDQLVSLFPIMDPGEVQALSDFILTSSVITFAQIIPSDVTVYDEAYMIAEGWFFDYQQEV